MIINIDKEELQRILANFCKNKINDTEDLNKQKKIVKIQDTNIREVPIKSFDGWTLEGTTPTANICIRAAIKTLKEAQKQLKEIIKNTK